MRPKGSPCRGRQAGPNLFLRLRDHQNALREADLGFGGGEFVADAEGDAVREHGVLQPVFDPAQADAGAAIRQRKDRQAPALASWQPQRAAGQEGDLLTFVENGDVCALSRGPKRRSGCLPACGRAARRARRRGSASGTPDPAHGGWRGRCRCRPSPAAAARPVLRGRPRRHTSQNPR